MATFSSAAHHRAHTRFTRTLTPLSGSLMSMCLGRNMQIFLALRQQGCLIMSSCSKDEDTSSRVKIMAAIKGSRFKGWLLLIFFPTNRGTYKWFKMEIRSLFNADRAKWNSQFFNYSSFGVAFYFPYYFPCIHSPLPESLPGGSHWGLMERCEDSKQGERKWGQCFKRNW